MKTSALSRILGNRKLRVIALAGCAGVVALLAGLRANEGLAKPVPGGSDAEQPVRIIDRRTLQLSPDTIADMGTIEARTEDFPETLGIQGSISVVENQVTVVPCRVGQNSPSRVDQVLKVTGDSVRAGEPLALLYSPDYVSAKEEYLLLRNKATPGGDLGGLLAEAREKLETMGLSAHDIAELPKSKDNHLVVRAVRDGVITSVNTMVGNLQNLGDTLFTTADLDKVWFSGDLYIEDLPKVHRGQKIVVRAEGVDRPLTGTISFISPVVDPNVRTVKVRAIIENPDHLLRAAMYGEGSLVLKDASALVVPQDAVLTLYGKSYCFKEIGKGRFEEVPVTVGRKNDTMEGITGGLAPGDEIVSKNLDILDHALDSVRSAN